MGNKKKKPVKHQQKGKAASSSSSSSSSLASCRHKGQASVSSRPPIVGCAVGGCEEVAGLRACLTCGLQACKPHSKRHWAKNHGHSLCWEVEANKVYCWDCDLTYRGELDDEVSKAVASVRSPGGEEEKDDEEKTESSSAVVVVSSSKPGNGLSNLGNSCYMNSVLQCLAYLPRLKSQLATDLKGGGPLGKALLATLRGIWSGSSGGGGKNAGRFVPSDLHKVVKSSFAQFRRGTQEDAHEFFRAIVDGIDMEQRDSFARDLFHLTTTSVVTCHGCANSFSRLEDSFDLSLSWEEKNQKQQLHKQHQQQQQQQRSSGKKRKGKRQARVEPEPEQQAEEEEEAEEQSELELVTLMWPTFGGKRFPIFREAVLPKFEEQEQVAVPSASTIVARADVEAGRYDIRPKLEDKKAFSLLRQFSDPEVLSGSDK